MKDKYQIASNCVIDANGVMVSGAIISGEEAAAFEAGRIAGLKEAAEIARDKAHTTDFRARAAIATAILARAGDAEKE